MNTLFQRAQQTANTVWHSKFYLPVLVTLGAVATITQTSFECMCLYVFIAVMMLFFCDDLMAIFAPVCFTLQISVEYYKDYSQLVPYMMYAIVPFALALAFNLIYYRRPVKIGKLFYPLAAVSAALILGGVGVISREDYFKPVSLYYMLGLGLGQLAIYVIFCTRLENKRSYDRTERIAKTLFAAGLLFAVVIFAFYVQNFEKFLERGGVLYYKPRNYLTSMFLMCIPSVCVLAKRSNLYLAGLAVMYAAMLLTGSRSGLIFGTFLVFLCLVHIFSRGKNRRRAYIGAAAAAIVVIAIVAAVYLLGMYSARIESAAAGDKTRIEFIKRGIAHFLSAPIFGIGIGNNADMSIFKAYTPGSMVFYHNFVIQIICSMGLCGVAAYAWNFIARAKLIWRNRRRDVFAFALSYFGILMMSLTNPGIFCPFPEAGLMTFLFAVIEKEDNKKRIGGRENEKSTQPRACTHADRIARADDGAGAGQL